MRTRSPCLDDETLAAFVDGRLEGSRRQSVVEHLADCEACYEVMVEALRLREAREGRPHLVLVPDPTVKSGEATDRDHHRATPEED